MGKAIGIDLGTTNSVMAILEGERPTTLENIDGNRLTPSVVGLSRDGERLVGELARTQAVMYPEDTIFSIKRFMGRNFRDPDVQRDIQMVPYKVTEADNGEVEVWLGGKPYSPAEISASIIAAMKQEAEEQIDEVTHAVITVPAYFGQRQKDATRTAGRLAGLQVMRVLPEPTAAALAYGIKAQSSDPKTLLVYDLGGGTFDVTVLLVASGVFTDLANMGDNHLGGDDFDQAIIDHIIAHTQRRYGMDLRGDQAALQKLKAAAERAKKSLSKRRRVGIAIPAIAKANSRFVDVELDLTRAEYEEMIRPYVRKTIDLVHQAIREADYRPEDIDHILLAGGSTLTPLVADSLRQEFGREKILRGVNPMVCVAQGAAIQTGILPPGEVEESADQPEVECPECGRLTLQGRKACWHCGHQFSRIGVTTVGSTAKPLGIQTLGDKMEAIIPKGTFYPTKEPKTRHFRTSRPNQTILRIPVYEGFEEIASQNEYLGVAQGELPTGLPDATEVAVSFSVDADGIIKVTAQLPDQPEVKIEAKIDWKYREQAPSMPGGGKPGVGPPQPRGWKEEAQATLAMAGFTLERGRHYLDQQTIYQLQGLGSELQQAIASDNEALARQKMADLGEAMNALGFITLLVFAEALAEHPDVSPAEGAKLRDLIQVAQQAMATRNTFQLNSALGELNSLVTEIVEGLQGAVTGLDDDLLGGLLRGSSSL